MHVTISTSLENFFANIGKFFENLFKVFAELFYTDVVGYFDKFIESTAEYTLLDWVMAFVVLLINLAFVVFLGLKLYQWIGRYIRFIKREIEKDELLEEISFLNEKTVELIEEKNKILALKVSNLGLSPEEQRKADQALEEEQDEVHKGPSRFTKLIAIDKEYENRMTQIR